MFTAQVYGGDVGGIDEDYEFETLEEAREFARRSHRKGMRPTEIYDEDWDLVDTIDTGRVA